MAKIRVFAKDGAREGEDNGEIQKLDVAHELTTGEEQAGPETGADTADVEAELAKVRSEHDSLLDRMARMQADFDNARKRAQREQQEYRDYALADAVRMLLPILDSFDRAIATNGSGDDVRKGVELINRQLHDALGKLGVEPVPAQGAPFDPNVHEALGMVETSEVPDNHVADELQRGYKLKGRLLRPAMVRVAKNT